MGKNRLFSINNLLTGVKGVLVGFLASIPATVLYYILAIPLAFIDVRLVVVAVIVVIPTYLMLWGYIWNRLPDFS